MPTLRKRSTCAALIAAATSLAACAGVDTDESADTVRVVHALGEVEVPADPQRVVALGPVDRDAAVAIGADLVGVAATDGRLAPWTQAGLDGGSTEILEASGESNAVDLEAVAALEPDVILASTYFEIDDQYDRLTQIAPTIAYTDDLLSDTWQQVTETVGEAVGLRDRAVELISEVESRIENVREENPQVRGATYTFVFPTPENARVLRDPDDIMNALTSAVGFEMSPLVLDQPAGDSFAIDVSYENLDVLEADVLGVYAPGGEGEAVLADQPLFGQLDVAERDSVVSFSDDEFIALRQPSVLSLPWAIDGVLQRLIDEV